MPRHSNMPYLWRHPKYGSYYAIWQEDGKTRRIALRPGNASRATKDQKIAKGLLRQFIYELFGGRVKSTQKEYDP